MLERYAVALLLATAGVRLVTGVLLRYAAHNVTREMELELGAERRIAGRLRVSTPATASDGKCQVDLVVRQTWR